MSPEKTKSLIDKYPIIFYKIKHLECSDGWYVLIDRLCSHLEHMIKFTSSEEEVRNLMHATQIKSKFGTLCFYMNNSTPAMNSVLDLAESLSGSICEECGNQGSSRFINQWVYTLCDDHFEENIDT